MNHRDPKPQQRNSLAGSNPYSLELEPPTVEPALVQQKLESEPEPGTRLRRAIVVPNTRIAFHARLAFGAGDYRVFYNDIAAAIHWLEAGGS